MSERAEQIDGERAADMPRGPESEVEISGFQMLINDTEHLLLCGSLLLLALSFCRGARRLHSFFDFASNGDANYAFFVVYLGSAAVIGSFQSWKRWHRIAAICFCLASAGCSIAEALGLLPFGIRLTVSSLHGLAEANFVLGAHIALMLWAASRQWRDLSKYERLLS